MELIKEHNGYKYWIGRSWGRPIFNALPANQVSPVSGYKDPSCLKEMRGPEISVSIFDPYLITEERAIKALKDATVSRGKNKGKLLAKCPKIGTDGAACWQAITSHANERKIGIFHMLCMEEKTKVIYDYFDHLIRTNGIDVRRMDRDREFLDLILNIW